MTKPASDEPEDPRAEIERHAEEMAQQLIRTAELPEKLGWTDFDFEVDPFDPVLEDLEGLIASGQRDREALTAILQTGLHRHVTLKVRHQILRALEERLQNEGRLDVRREAQLVLRALHQLSLPAPSIGLFWALYPRHLMQRLNDRHQIYQREERELTDRERALQEHPDPEELRKLGERARPVVDRVIRSWAEKPPSSVPLAGEICALAAQWPDLRMARTLGTVLWNVREETILAAARAALGRMPEAARTILDLDISLHDPPPEVRLAIYPALVDLGSPMAVARMVEDLAGGTWSKSGKGVEHALPILREIVRAKDARAVPMMLFVMSVRPPEKDVRAAILAAFAESPLKEEFEIGLKSMDAGRPVVVTAGMSQEEFFARYGAFTERMRPDKFQAEVQRATRLWEECYHEALGWRRPHDLAQQLGPIEQEMRQRLEKDVQIAMGRMAGRAPLAALESEYRTQWMVTPQNDVSGRVPLAIILDERAARGGTPRSMEDERRQQSSELYALALRSIVAGLREDAERYLRAVLQITPGHSFALDALERLGKGESFVGVGEGEGEGEEPPPGPSRIIIPG